MDDPIMARLPLSMTLTPFITAPKEVTKVLSPEQVLQDANGKLQLNLDSSVEYKPNFCFAAGTLVHTKEGLKPIEQIKVGDWVLSKDESGEGDQAYKRVTKTFRFEDKEVAYLKYISTPLEKIEHVLVTPNHPFFVQGAGWVQAADVSYPDKLDSYDGTSLDAWECLTLWKTKASDVAIALGRGADEGQIVDFSSGTASTDEGLVSAEASTYEIFTRTVYNLEVEDFHTYYVGELGVWVHNTNCGGEGDVGRTQKASLSPDEPAKNTISELGTIVYGRENGALSPVDLKAPAIILEYQYSSAVIDEAAKFEQSLLGACQGKLDLKEWTNTFLDGKLSLGPIDLPFARENILNDFRCRAEALNQMDKDLVIVIKNTRGGLDNLAKFNEAVDFISTVVSKQDYWIKQGLYKHLAVNFEGRNTVIRFDEGGAPYEIIPEFTATRIVNGKPADVSVQAGLNKTDYPPIYTAPNGQTVVVPKPDPACFTIGTPVHTPSGIADIDLVSVGSLVLSRSEITGEQCYKKIVRKFEHHDREIVGVSYRKESGKYSSVQVTPEHPFWVNGIGWVPAGKLQPGHKLEICAPFMSDNPWGWPSDDPAMEAALERRMNGRWTATVVSVTSEGRASLVYNLEVEEFHTYFVDHDGVWVHNTKAAPAIVMTLNRGTPTALPVGKQADANIMGKKIQARPCFSVPV